MDAAFVLIIAQSARERYDFTKAGVLCQKGWIYIPSTHARIIQFYASANQRLKLT
jgi:hypothetical protein